MRHHAALFAIIGGFSANAAFMPAIQPIAVVVASVSIGSFFYLAISAGGYTGASRKF
jgi:hypothetical protein